MLLILDPHLIHSPDFLFDILLNYWIIPENSPTNIYIYIYIYIRVRGSPERDILSLRTLGLGLARFGRPSAGAARPNLVDPER